MWNWSEDIDIYKVQLSNRDRSDKGLATLLRRSDYKFGFFNSGSNSTNQIKVQEIYYNETIQLIRSEMHYMMTRCRSINPRFRDEIIGYPPPKINCKD